MTKHYRRLYFTFLIFSILLTLGPLVVYSLKALLSADLVHEKVSLMMTVFIVLIMTCISLVNKCAMKSRLWVLLIGIYLCLDSILEPLMVIAGCQVLEELIVSPLRHRFKDRLVINKQIDRRV